jgi:hypothetical protein
MFVLLLFAVPVVGCAPSTATPSADSAQRPVAEDPAVRIEAMSPSDKRFEIAENFPAEVPVPVGRVIRGTAQGEDAWDYEIVLDFAPAAVVEWYRSAFASRSWVVVDESGPAGGSATGPYELTLQKGAAESRVVVSAEGEGARALVVLGVGAPVLQTQ